MKTCIVSDHHDRADTPVPAVAEADAAGADVIIACADDVHHGLHAIAHGAAR